MGESGDGEKKVVQIESRLDHAVRLRVYDMIDNAENAGFAQNASGATARRRGESVVVMPGTITEVDEEFWRAWIHDNEGSALASHLVEVKEESHGEAVGSEEADPGIPRAGQGQPEKLRG